MDKKSYFHFTECKCFLEIKDLEMETEGTDNLRRLFFLENYE